MRTLAELAVRDHSLDHPVVRAVSQFMAEYDRGLLLCPFLVLFRECTECWLESGWHLRFAPARCGAGTDPRRDSEPVEAECYPCLTWEVLRERLFDHLLLNDESQRYHALHELLTQRGDEFDPGASFERYAACVLGERYLETHDLAISRLAGTRMFDGGQQTDFSLLYAYLRFADGLPPLPRHPFPVQLIARFDNRAAYFVCEDMLSKARRGRGEPRPQPVTCR